MGKSVKLFRKKEATLPRRRTGVVSEELQRSSESFAFQRNRTLTGSVSSHISSVNELNADMKSPRVQTHELTKKRRHIGALLGMVLLISLGLYGLVYDFTASVTLQLPNEVSVQPDAKYEDIIQDYLSSHPIERLRLFLNEEQLDQYVQSRASEVSSIRSQGWAGFGNSRFFVTPRRPIAGWMMNNTRQYVDASGVAFSRNYYASPAVQIADNSGAQAQSGQAVASNRFLGFIGRVVGIAGGRGLTVTQVAIPAGTTRQIEVKLEGYDYPVKLSIDRSAGEQVEDMDRAVEWLRSQNKKAQYVDVRVAGKAFYQ